MSYYTEADQYAGYEAIRDFSAERHAAEVVTAILDAVAPAIVARAQAEALRELAGAAGNSRLPVLDGGSSHIDILRRADEIEASYTSDPDIYRKSP